MWNLLTQRKGQQNCHHCFSLISRKLLNKVWSFFFFTFRLYLFGVKLKRKLVPFCFSSLKIKMWFFDYNDVMDLFWISAIYNWNIPQYSLFKISIIIHFGSCHGIILIFLLFSAYLWPLYSVLKITAGQRSLTRATTFVTAK